jgi:multidrug efflux pump subunit AcrA (membrane-fusion protein)
MASNTDVVMKKAAAADQEHQASLAAQQAAAQTIQAQLQTQHQAQLQAMQEQITLMQQQQQAQMKALAEKVKAEAAASDMFLKYVPDVTVDDVPTIAVPTNKDLLAKYGQVHTLLTCWKQAGEAVPFTFSDLINHTAFGSDIPLTMRSTLGESLWPKWFLPNPGETTTVPKQAVLLFYSALEKLKQEWEGEQATTQAAANSYTEFCGTVKRRRGELLAMQY